MKPHFHTIRLGIGILILCLLVACKSDHPQDSTSNIFNIGIPSDPEKLHPAFNAKSKAREIFQNIFLPLADYDPETFTLIPILIESIPKGKVIRENRISYDVKIKNEATWADGSPLTAYDIAFAYKVMSHTQSQTAVWKPYLKIIKDISINEDSNKEFTIVCERSSMHSKEIGLTLYPIQESRYDPNQHLRKYSIQDWIKGTKEIKALESDTLTNEVIATFNQPETYRKDISHAGRYQVQDWVTDQYVMLTKIENHWAEKEKTNPYLKAGSDTILFKIIKDENSLATLLKSGGIDMTMYLNPQQYIELKDDQTIGSKYDYHLIETMKIAYLELNNRDPELQEVAVREALCHSIDIPSLLEAEENGLGTLISVLVHPSKRYYPKQLLPRNYDTEKAISLLENAGWKDTNNDGTRDKTINDKQEELVIDFYISGSKLTSTIALLLQDAAKKVGFKINVIQKDARAYIKENVMTHNYEMAALSASFNEVDTDPYTRWHSESTTTAGRNRCGFTSPGLDSIITLIRKENDSDLRLKYYEEFCKILYEGVPIIPLFAPVDIITVDKRYHGVSSSKRPGYMANTFTLQ